MIASAAAALRLASGPIDAGRGIAPQLWQRGTLGVGHPHRTRLIKFSVDAPPLFLNQLNQDDGADRANSQGSDERQRRPDNLL